MLRHVGLVQAVTWLCQQVSSQYDVDVNYKHRNISGNIQYDIELAAFRIVQEALLNAAKHAQVEHIEIEMWAENKSLLLEVIDEGKGFDLNHALNDRNTHGLFTMRERAAAVGGYALLQSRPNEGTSVTVNLPYQVLNAPALPNASLPAAQVFNTVTEDLIGEDGSSRRTVIIAEENDLVRQGLRTILTTEGNYAVRAEVQTLRGLRNLIQDIHADVLIMSYTLSESNTGPILNELAQLQPDMRLIVLSSYPQSAYAHSCMINGADGYILKQSGSKVLLAALGAHRARRASR